MNALKMKLEWNVSIEFDERDFVTGAAPAKINALVAAIQNLGGTIEYPPVVEPELPESWTFANATLEGNQLNYFGGVVTGDFGGDVQDVPALHLHRPVHVNDAFRFVIPESLTGVASLNIAVSHESSNFVNVPDAGVYAQVNNNRSVDICVGGTAQATAPSNSNVNYVYGRVLEGSVYWRVVNAANEIIVEETLDFDTTEPLYLWCLAIFSTAETAFSTELSYIAGGIEA